MESFMIDLYMVISFVFAMALVAVVIVIVKFLEKRDKQQESIKKEEKKD